MSDICERLEGLAKAFSDVRTSEDEVLANILREAASHIRSLRARAIGIAAVGPGFDEIKRANGSAPPVTGL